MIASTRGTWAVAQQNIRIEEAEKDCASIWSSYRAGDIGLGEAGRLLAMAVGTAEDDVAQLAQFIAAGGAA